MSAAQNRPGSARALQAVGFSVDLGWGCAENLESGSETGKNSDCRAPISRLLRLKQWPLHKDCGDTYLAC